MTNVVVQIIILLYLIDNNEQTSWMILMGSGVGVAIEAWKVRYAACTFLGKTGVLRTPHDLNLDHQGRGH